MVLCLGSSEDLDGFQTKGAQDIAVAGVARRRQGHPVAHIKGGKEGESEGTRRALRDGDAAGWNIDTIPTLVKIADTSAQFVCAQGQGVAEGVIVERLLDGFTCCGRGWRSRLADFEMVDRAAFLLGILCCPHDVHHAEGINSAPFCDLQPHVPAFSLLHFASRRALAVLVVGLSPKRYWTALRPAWNNQCEFA